MLEVIGWVGKGVDVLVYTEREFARRSEVPGTAPYWARREGKVLWRCSTLTRSLRYDDEDLSLIAPEQARAP